TAGTTSAASPSNTATVSPVRCRKTVGCFRRWSSRAIIGALHGGESRPDILRTRGYRECGLLLHSVFHSAPSAVNPLSTTPELFDQLREAAARPQAIEVGAALEVLDRRRGAEEARPGRPAQQRHRRGRVALAQ